MKEKYAFIKKKKKSTYHVVQRGERCSTEGDSIYRRESEQEDRAKDLPRISN
jgi:hypothetical protein